MRGEKNFFAYPSMSWRGRGKGSSDVIRRGQAFRTVANLSYEPFPSSYSVDPPLPVSAKDALLINSQRLLVNHLLSSDVGFRIPLGGLKPEGESLWKRLAEEFGDAYYPIELLTDSRSTMLGIAKKQKIPGKTSKSLAELENSEKKIEGETSPKSREDEAVLSESSDESVDDYNVRMDVEDEGARDDFDDNGDDGGDYGGEF